MNKTIHLLTGLFFLATRVAMSQVSGGNSILSDGLTSFSFNGPEAVVKKVEVADMPFTKAFQVNTFAPGAKPSSYNLTATITTPLHKNDMLWISFWSRCLQSTRETGEASFELRFDNLVNGKYVWPPHLERGISFGTKWTQTSIPFIITKDATPESTRLVIHLDSYPQRFELGPVTFVNYGATKKLADLPRTVVKYEGSEPDAPWRKVAAEGIEKYRKGDLTIKVLDAKGKPLKDADVSVNMKRIAFNWGTAMSSRRLLDTLSPEAKKYSDTLMRYFNHVVFDNEMKWGVWLQQDEKTRFSRTKEAIRILKAHNITSRGHVMVWPSWNNSPAFLAKFKDDTAAVNREILKQIDEQTTAMRGQFTEWDVVNEPYAHEDYLKWLGPEKMVDWFKAARKGAPGVKLFLNDYTMFIGEGPSSRSQTFYDNIKFLKEKGAPIDVIGEEGHIGGTPPGIPKVIERLTYFSQLGLPIQVSEFDINSYDDDYKAHYMDDFMTAVFGHPNTVGFVQWGFWEGGHWFPAAAMWNKDWTIRENGRTFTNLVTKKWWTTYTGKTTPTGACRLRGFCGDYEITVKYKGKTLKKNYSLSNQGGTIAINL